MGRPRWVFGILPALVIYTDDLPDGRGGEARGPVIRLRQKYRDDAGIHAHERVHVRQWWRTLGLHSLLYLFSKSYRFRAEVEAYREQLRHYPQDRSVLFALYLTDNYRLDVTFAQALEALRQ